MYGEQRDYKPEISIHPLRVERDGGSFSECMGAVVFQSTLSVWRGTVLPRRLPAIPAISIHPLRVERD